MKHQEQKVRETQSAISAQTELQYFWMGILKLIFLTIDDASSK